MTLLDRIRQSTDFLTVDVHPGEWAEFDDLVATGQIIRTPQGTWATPI